MKVKDIVKKLEEKFPLKNAEDWDNIGLLIGDYNKEVKKIQFSIDVTLEAIENAVRNEVDMIISHHPIIFKAIKSIREQDILGKKIRKLIKNDISVYSIHTNLDATREGLNDYVLEKLGYKKSKILDVFEEDNVNGIGRIYQLDEEIPLIDYIAELKSKLKIENLRLISKNTEVKIKKVALINGSAMSYWRMVKDKNIDLFITGDVSYHDALDALETGMNIVDFGHYESEHFFYEILIRELKEKELDFIVFNDGPIFKFL